MSVSNSSHVFRVCAAAGGLILLLAPSLRGQQQAAVPRIGYAYPAGGQRGTTFQVMVGGRFLDRVARAMVAGGGVDARIVEHDKPLPPKELTSLRQRVQELQKMGPDATARREVAEIRLRIADSVRRNRNPVLSEIVTLEVTIAPDASPGPRYLRLLTPLGLTNPVVFAVGELPEFREIEKKTSPADRELTITLPAVVNGRLIPGDVDRLQAPLRQPGQYMPGDVDRYRFRARKGQALVIAASARDLTPYLADAVPGWFQATLRLADASGREIAYADDYRFQPDPVLHCVIPSDGDYVLEIKDALFRGREDFVYRIAIGELAFVTGIFPLGGRTGTNTVVAVAGWNLPPGKVTMDAKDKAQGIFPLSVRGAGAESNRVPFAVDTLPETLERESNGSPREAQAVTLPVIVNGRIDRPGDVDVFRFAGRAGDRVVAEVLARRLLSPLDSALELTDAAGRRLAFNDDHEDKGAGLITHHADSLLAATLPATGTYYVSVSDTQRHGGPDCAYRLRLGPPRPDFDLRVAPSAVNVSPGATVPLAVHVLRRDGFTGDVMLALRDAPGGFALSGAVVPAGQEHVRVTITAPPGVAAEPMTVSLEGRALVEGKEVVRRAAAAEDMMQAFAYQHLVVVGDLQVSIVGRGGTRVPSRLLGPQPVRIPAGGSATVRVSLPPAYRTFTNLQFDLSEPPDGFVLRDLSLGPAGASFVLDTDGTKVPPGSRGNLIVTISGERPRPANQAAPAARPRAPLATLPAIAYEVVSRTR